MKIYKLIVFIAVFVTNQLICQDKIRWEGSLFFGKSDQKLYLTNKNNLFKYDFNGNWNKLNSSEIFFFAHPNYNFNDKLYIDSLSIWALKGTVSYGFGKQPILSKDGGINWEKISIKTSIFNEIERVDDIKFTKDYIFILSNSRIYMSSKNIIIWKKIFDFKEFFPDKILAEKSRGIEDWVISNDDIIYISFYDLTIIKSKNNFSSWVNTSSSNTMRSTPGVLKFNKGRLFVGTYWEGIFYSDDKGNSFSSSAGLPKGRGISQIIIGNDSEVFALVSDQMSTIGYFMSFDNGKTFKRLETPFNYWESYFFEDLVRTEKSIIINANQNGFWETKDFGLNWNPINNNFKNDRLHHISKIDVDELGNIYLLSKINIYNGQKVVGRFPEESWGINYIDVEGNYKKLDDFLYDEYHSLEDMNVINSENIFVSTYTPGSLNLTQNKGAEWKTSKLNISTISCITNIGADTIFLGTYWDGILKSNDRGKTWRKIKNGINQRTENDITKGTGILSLQTQQNGTNLYSIFRSQSRYDGFYYSKDFGESWEVLSKQDIDQFSVYENIIATYVQDGYDYDNASKNIYISKDNLITKKNITYNLDLSENRFVNFLQVVNVDKSKTQKDIYVFICNNDGIYALNEKSEKWINLTTTPSLSFKIHPKTFDLLIGGVEKFEIIPFQIWKKKLSELPLSTHLEDFSKVYPNPFDDKVKIEFPTEYGSDVKVSISDIKGSIIYSKERVINSEILNLSHLSSGTYFLSIIDKDSLLKKLIKLIKEE